MADTEPATTVRYGMPGVVTVTVPYGIDPVTHQQVPLDDDDAVTAEPVPQPVEQVKSKPVRKVVNPGSKGVGTA